MHDNHTRDLDALIETALSSDEAWLTPPPTLRGGVEKRLRFARMRDQEARRFKFATLFLLFGVLGGFSGTAFWAYQALASPLVQHGIAGGRGFLDYYSTAFTLAWSEQQSYYIVPALLVLALSSLALAILPFRKSWTNN